MYDIKTTFRAESVQDAVRLLSENQGAVIVCGGTDVMIRLRELKLRQATLISILDIPELCGVRLEENGDLLIGAGTCFSLLHSDPLIRRCVPILAEASRQVGSPQIRNIATIGGNICNGAVSADSAPSLLVLDARLELASPGGSRTLPIRDFYTGPGKTVLKAEEEILTGIRIPREKYAEHGGCYLKFGMRNAMEISTLGCAVNLALFADGTIRDFAIAFGVAAPTPIRCPKAEAMMIGKKPCRATIQALQDAVILETQPRESWRASKELRLQLIRELSARATTQAIETLGGEIHV